MCGLGGLPPFCGGAIWPAGAGSNHQGEAASLVGTFGLERHGGILLKDINY